MSLNENRLDQSTLKDVKTAIVALGRKLTAALGLPNKFYAWERE